MQADTELIERVRAILLQEEGVSERRMFGGIAFMIDGNMCCGVTNDLLVLRLGAQGAAAALAQPHTREMDFTGRTLSTMVYVEGPGVRSDKHLRAWVQRAVRFVRTLPPKRAKYVRKR